ncbi:bifunctional nicotinamide-nucleotide adenylyltransferase/Nudix hydroxylase [Caldimonas brevitalea]|uniref:Cytidyltransferase n=1 Tax=Caldimonas brevitalea TaxID=413882 RepID=A0A0G3BLD8_9BURK|nr:bifunctional nicotinamide-nucleotide adenylyltransferase/Nudix hydroxylase [Caldimonas brevitalea]AKJ28211.1 cytidyltransferase [Caldimonas brevitalea]
MPQHPPSPACDLSLLIGRFQPLHNGHLALLQQALGLAPRCVVVIGSAFQARTPRNPFTWQERAQMLRLALPEADRGRLHFLPVRDYYDDTRWIGAVRAGVAQLQAEQGLPAHATVALVGHLKDATSDYLGCFPSWRLEPVQRVGRVDGRHLRDVLFGSAGHAVDASLATLVELAPPSTLDFLRAFAALPFYAELAEEWRTLKHYKEAWASAPYPPVFVTVDSVVRVGSHVLLVKRGQAPGKGLYAVPGGFIEQRETAYQSALRELKEETGLSLLDVTMRQCLKAAVVFDHPDRSQRGRTITHAHYFDLGERELPEVQGGDDAAGAEWVPIERLTQMEDCFLDDHFHMLDHFLGLTPR